MAIKKFGSATKKADKVEPIEFEFYGEVIQAKRYVPIDEFLIFAEKMQSDEDGDKLSAINKYLDISFDAANKKKWKAVLADESVHPSMDELMEVINFLTTERTANPTKES